MKINTLSAIQNSTVLLQRRSLTVGVNSLGEVNYGEPSTWPIVPSFRDPKYTTPSEWTNDPTDYIYPYHQTRIEFNVENLQFTPTGERTVQNQTLMFIAFMDYMQAEDRITVLNINNVPGNIDPGLNQYYIILAVWPEHDSVGNINHFVAELNNL